MDRLTPAARSANMRAVRSKDTRPEMRVRRAAHVLGFRFRLHRRDLPGTPDLVFPKRRTVIFVHGCFWHQHEGCRKSAQPKSRSKFWRAKFKRNVARDRLYQAELQEMGWNVVVIWECETHDEAALQNQIRDVLTSAYRV